ncbi:MAG TPA: hypothetical protein VGE62_04155 [Candidatus Paceibacterota bacterium]
MLRTSLVSLIIKIGLSVSLLYAALASFVVPAMVVERWPSFISQNLSEAFLSAFTGLGALVYIVWLFSRKYRFSATASLTVIIALFGLSNIQNVGLIFQLAPLFSISLALTLRYYPRVRVLTQTKVSTLTYDGSHDQVHGDNGKKKVNSEKDHDQHLFIPTR